MAQKSKEHSKRLFEWWANSVREHALAVIITAALFTGVVLLYSIKNFKINVDVSGMISDKLHFRKIENDFSAAFPALTDTIVIVLDADTAELAISARKRLSERLRKETALFKTVYEPGGGDFFEKNGLLYMNTDELEDLADNMAGAQPLIGLLNKDLSLRGIFSVLGKTLEQLGGESQRHEDLESQDKRINLLFDRVSRAFDGVTYDKPYSVSWLEMMSEKEAAGQRRQFIILRPYLDPAKLSAGMVPLDKVREIIKELKLNEDGVKAHITGDVALNEENMMEVRSSIGIATLASLFLVSVILYIGLGGSVRLIFAALTTLIVGLIWTTGFAIAFIGSLNMISITFAVLFIGLGIDYSIQFCLRYKELIESESDKGSIAKTAKGVGMALLLSCITTAIGFYSFLPTAYAGVAELGLISGTGMFISFFANLTILPALLTLFPLKEKILPPLKQKTCLRLPYKYPGFIGMGALVLGIGAALLLPKVYFDYNPLNLYNQKSESVVTVKELFKDPDTSPWTISILARGAEEAKGLAERLRKLKEVKMAVTIFDFVPENQPEKLGIISNVALFMPKDMQSVGIKQLSHMQNIKALNDLEKAIRKSSLSADSPSKKLYESIRRFKTILKDPVRGRAAFEKLEKALLSNLPVLFKMLNMSLHANSFDLSSLPKDLASQYVSSDNRYRVQVFPSEDIIDENALARFVKSVRTVSPDATDAPVTIYESGMAVVSSFRQATLYAIAAIVIFLLIESRSLSITGLTLIPLVLAMLMTGAASVMLGIPLNFANVIVVPLLLGTGVHTGIIFILRYRTDPPLNGNMLTTSTARAVLFSSLTTMISTGSLSFSSHRGISSMGILLTICFGFLIISTLILLPALLELYSRRFKS